MHTTFTLFSPAFKKDGAKIGPYILINEQRYTWDETQILLENLARSAIDEFLCEKREALGKDSLSKIGRALTLVDEGSNNPYLNADRIIAVLAAEAARIRTHQIALARAVEKKLNQQELTELKTNLYPLASTEQLIDMLASFFNESSHALPFFARRVAEQILALEKVRLLFSFANNRAGTAQWAKTSIEKELDRQNELQTGPR